MTDLSGEETSRPKLLDFFRTRGYQLYLLTREDLQLAADDTTLQGFLNSQGYFDPICSTRVFV